MIRDNNASIGIGTLITFIAIVLVSMVVCSTIIITYEKTFKSQANSADKEALEYGKIVIESIFTYTHEPCWQSTSTDPECNFPGGHHQLLMFFHLGPGSTQLSDTNIFYHVRCENEVGELHEVFKSERGASFDDDNAFGSRRAVNDGTRLTPLEMGRVVLQSDHSIAVDTLEIEKSYLLKIEMYDNQNTVTTDDDEGCRITPDKQTTLLIVVGGGAPTEYKLNFRNYDVGELII